MKAYPQKNKVAQPYRQRVPIEKAPADAYFPANKYEVRKKNNNIATAENDNQKLAPITAIGCITAIKIIAQKKAI
jgi:hypothetical protein